jgi:hypothetical protein
LLRGSPALNWFRGPILPHPSDNAPFFFCPEPILFLHRFCLLPFRLPAHLTGVQTARLSSSAGWGNGVDWTMEVLHNEIPNTL